MRNTLNQALRIVAISLSVPASAWAGSSESTDIHADHGRYQADQMEHKHDVNTGDKGPKHEPVDKPDHHPDNAQPKKVDSGRTPAVDSQVEHDDAVAGAHLEKQIADMQEIRGQLADNIQDKALRDKAMQEVLDFNSERLKGSVNHDREVVARHAAEDIEKMVKDYEVGPRLEPRRNDPAYRKPPALAVPPPQQ